MDSLTIVTIIIGVIMTLSAIMAVYHSDTATAIIAAGMVSLMASLLYVFLAAPDVAMTEAAIGSGLSTIIFFYALSKVRGGKKDDH
ncbi:DUF4040 domain-containing protein [bacterium]|nr:DUF4040 domain-containing protein [bacterium]